MGFSSEILTFQGEGIAPTMVESDKIVFSGNAEWTCLAGDLESKGVDKDKVGKDFSKIVKFLECRGVFTPINWLEIGESILS